MIAREALTIFVEGDEEPGLIAYGLIAPGEWDEVEFPSGAWPTSPEPGHFTLHGDSWQVHGWEVLIAIWPTGSSFQDAVHRTLEALIHGGCRVAWIGAEGVPFCDPPGLFDPDSMSGGVLAWMTDDGGFDCPLDPDHVLAAVSDRALRALRAHARGLADAAGGSA